MSLSLWCCTHIHEWVWLSAEQGCCGQSLNEPQGPGTPGTGGKPYGLAGENYDKCSTRQLFVLSTLP